MRTTVLNKTAGSFTFLLLLLLPRAHAVAASSDLLKVKGEAEAKGYIFFATHDEIVAGAKKEGKLRVSCGLESPNFQPWISAFKRKYPFITELQVEEIQGTDAYQRFILEMKSGQAKAWDIAHIPIDFGKEYLAYLSKHDIYGMARQGILKIPQGMLHPIEKNVLSATSTITVVPYNKKLIPEDKVPNKWEDFLKPEFKEKKFVVDLRPLQVAGLVPAWGLEKTLDFARKLAAQQPVWGRGATRVNTAIAAGEHSFYLGSNFESVKRAMSKDATGNLSYKIIEPVPTRVVDHASGILKTAEHPYAALLWLEFLASPEGQDIIDKYEPLRASVYTPGSVIEQVTRGKKLSIVDWDHFTKFQDYQEKIFAAYGFPKADK